MELNVRPGKYVVAVSGGVDSMVLLDVLSQRPDLELVVAHFDHGIRPDSAEDAAFVEARAKDYGLPFITKRVALGASASEATARQARYAFLQEASKQGGAQAIITAHHQDDLLETAIINMLRGTGRRGLTSLQSTEQIVRPLLHATKQDIVSYAVQRNLSWREDSTNYDERYTRNYIRHRLLVKLDADARRQLLATLSQTRAVNDQLEPLLAQLIAEHSQDGALKRQWLISLPHQVACEVMAQWLRQAGIADFDRPAIERLVIQSKVKPVGKRLDVLRGHSIIVGRTLLALEPSKR